MIFESCKTFYNMGQSLNKCFDCSYCFIKNANFKNMRYPNNTNVPVSINMFYGDPLLQLNKTIEILNELEKRKHKGIVFICTKGDFSKFPNKKYNLNLWIGFSTFGKESHLTGSTFKTFLNNLKVSKQYPYNFLIEFRPIIENINDSEDIITHIIQLAETYNYPISYAGLKEKEWKVNENIKRLFSKSCIPTGTNTRKLIQNQVINNG
jgi:hypothetical protein